jgi:hypothetical protein
MGIVIGPVLRRADGYRFDTWTVDKGVGRGYPCRRIEDAHYARNSEIKASAQGRAPSATSARPSTNSSRNPPGARWLPPPDRACAAEPSLCRSMSGRREASNFLVSRTARGVWRAERQSMRLGSKRSGLR